MTAAAAIAIGAAVVLPARAVPAADTASEHTSARIPVVRVGIVAPAPASREVTFYAEVRAADRALVAFAQPGRMVSRPVNVGDVVTEGQTVAMLDEAPLRNQQRAADAAIRDVDEQLAQLDREAERATRLIDAEIGSGQALERIESQRRQLGAARAAAAARRDEARRMRGDTTVVAPVAGVIAEVYVEPGEVVGPGTPVALIVGQGAVEVEIDVPENVFSSIREGDDVLINFPMSERSGLHGTVRAVGRASGGRGRLFPVVIALNDAQEVVPGMSAEVRIALPVSADVAVPAGALVDPAGTGAIVFRIRDGIAERVPVSVVGIDADALVLDGELAVGDQVVVAGHGMLQEGARVEARQ